MFYGLFRFIYNWVFFQIPFLYFENMCGYYGILIHSKYTWTLTYRLQGYFIILEGLKIKHLKYFKIKVNEDLSAMLHVKCVVKVQNLSLKVKIYKIYSFYHH